VHIDDQIVTFIADRWRTALVGRWEAGWIIQPSVAGRLPLCGPLRVVLTGGPGGGKTTAADLFRREIGDRVVIVPSRPRSQVSRLHDHVSRVRQ
jgi:hypothetical protein